MPNINVKTLYLILILHVLVNLTCIKPIESRISNLIENALGDGLPRLWQLIYVKSWNTARKGNTWQGMKCTKLFIKPRTGFSEID